MTSAWRTMMLCAALSAGSAAPAHNLHLHFTEAELRQTFAVNRHDDVPEYDVFHVRSRQRRSVDGRARRSVHVNAFGNRIDLDLQANHEIDDRIRLFYADVGDAGINIERVRGDTAMHVGELYQDVAADAALLVDHAADGTLQLNGVVADLVIAPAPRRLHRLVPPPNDGHPLLTESETADLRLLNGTGSGRRRRSAAVTSGLHLIFQRRHHRGLVGSAPLAPADDEAFLEPEPGQQPESRPERDTGRRKRAQGDDLFPEVLVIVDYDTYAVHNYDAATAKRYIMSFMNAIDLRYKQVSFPSITIKVAGIVISKSKEATPYLENNLVEGIYLDAVSALSSIGRYLYNENRLPSYDAALVLTKRDMCTRNGNWGSCNKVTAGYAYVGGGCSISKYFSKINSVALVEDSGGFSGIIVATHELGHLMGAVHDGSPPASYVGGPGALSCAWTDGYIMSDLRRDYKGLQWSTCSISQFAHFANDRRSACMQNYPSQSQDVSSGGVLPGKLISLDAQCKRDRGSSACFKDHRVCAELYCFEQTSGYCVSFRPAAEGSSCGQGMHCRNGFCEPESFFY
ncbi:A disintegrin and metalloproteinase with thrombospondin motifs 18-like [Amphibalanus amphitrite]|uniref:A disintegrin and metalloproteinase with thrombospondin motifs 18-like n=1 Tax=Amphibalanus amphitrite TaxID=1232801 RepID=UPI001C9287E7|nr:A disintegrin and metalloproteinase with thrombospondin motifs 18-like [Amphibalanus amphitrite]